MNITSFKNPFLILKLWQLDVAIIGIFRTDFFSCAYSENSYKVYLTKLNIKKNLGLKGSSKKPIGCVYGGCSLMVEHATVARRTRVRFSPSALLRSKRWLAEFYKIPASTLNELKEEK